MLIPQGYEGANVDGAFFCGTEKELAEFQARFGPDDTYDKWKWALSHQGATFITFDVKYVSLRASRTRMQDYSFTEITKTSINENAELYLLCFEGVADYTAIVPKLVWEKASSVSHGIDPLIANLPSWCFGFMVHDDDIRTVILDMISASVSQSGHVRNPTVGTILTGYRPRATQTNYLIPTLGGQVRARSSYEAVTWLWTMLDKMKPRPKVHFNPLAPLICDYLLEIPGLQHALRIEAKSSVALGAHKALGMETGIDRSPFAPARQWHFLILQAGAGISSFLCIGRHEVQDMWQDQAYWRYEDYSEFVFDGADALERMIDHMRCNYSEAIEKVRHIAVTAGLNAVDLKSLVTSNAVDRIEEALKDATCMSPASLVCHTPGLPWVAAALNGQCRRAERGICFALDSGHPVCSHVMLDWHWTHEEGERYDTEGKLPVFPFSQKAMDLPCVPLDFVDMSGAKNALPLGMREFYWTIPIIEQNFLMIGSTFASQDLDPTTEFTPSNYLMFPSQHLSLMDGKVRKPVSTEGYDGGAFFRRIYQALNAADPELWTSQRTDVLPFNQKSVFISDSEVDPKDYFVNLQNGRLRAQIFEIFEEGDEMRIKGFQEIKPNKPISKALYRSTLRVMHQAAWDFGGTSCCLHISDHA